MSDEATLHFYAENAAAYAGSSQSSTRDLRRFLARLTPGAEILELGTGSGRDAAAMLAQGFEVSPTDASPELAAEAERLLGRPVAIMAFNGLSAVSRYDGVWASAALLHAPADELTADLALIHRALRPGGWLAASFKAGTGEGRDQFGRYYNYPSAEVLREHVHAAGVWRQFELTETDGSGYDKLPTRWLWVHAQRP